MRMNLWMVIVLVMLYTIEVRVGFKMVGNNAKLSCNGWKRFVVSWGISFIVGGVFAVKRSMSGREAWILSLIGLGLILIAMILLMRKDWSSAFFSITNYLFFAGALDFLFTAFFDVKIQGNIHMETEIVLPRMVVLGISKCVLFGGCGIVYPRLRKKSIRGFEKKSIRVLGIIVCILEFVGLHVFYEILIYGTRMNDIFLRHLLVYLLVMILFLVIFMILINYVDKKTQLKIKNMQIDSLNYDYQKMMKLYRQKAAIYHDFKNHLLSLQYYIDQNDICGYKAYMNQIMQPFYEFEDKIQTGHDILDLIINHKYREAQEKGIPIKWKIEGTIKFHLCLTDDEVCALMSNIWDNALEACEKLKAEERRIEFILEVNHKTIYFSMKNSCDRNHAETVETSKKDKSMHGIGLRNIKAIISAHNGKLVYGYNDNVFQLEYILYN